MKCEPSDVRHLVDIRIGVFTQSDLPDDPSLPSHPSLPSLPAEVADRKHERRLWIFPL